MLIVVSKELYGTVRQVNTYFAIMLSLLKIRGKVTLLLLLSSCKTIVMTGWFIEFNGTGNGYAIRSIYNAVNAAMKKGAYKLNHRKTASLCCDNPLNS